MSFARTMKVLLEAVAREVARRAGRPDAKPRVV